MKGWMENEGSDRVKNEEGERGRVWESVVSKYFKMRSLENKEYDILGQATALGEFEIQILCIRTLYKA